MSTLLIDDPSEKFTIYDPQADASGSALPPGTETALPPDDSIRRFFAALENGGGRPYLYYDLSDAGRYFNARTSLARAEIQSSPSGGAYVDVDLGALTVRVSTHKDSSSPIPVLHVPGVNLQSLVVVKSYSRSKKGAPRLDFVSAFAADNQAAGPIATMDLTGRNVNMSGDCHAEGWASASEVPPITVDFPPITGCTLGQCGSVAAAWIRATHDVWRVRQMIELMDTKTEGERSYLWSRPAAGAAGELGAETSLAYYFGGFSQYRYEAIRWAFAELWKRMHDHMILASAIDLECLPGGGDICNTVNPPMHHAVISNIKVCPSFWSQEVEYRPLLMVHEPLHHMSVPWNDNGPRSDPMQDTHTHGHGNTCLSDIDTYKSYGLDEVRHLATYAADDGGTCSHRNLAFRNNDSYGWAASTIGRSVRFGHSLYWPAQNNGGGGPIPTFEPCDSMDPPVPGAGWQDELNDCHKINQELVCPGSGGGAVGSNLPGFDLALECL